MLSDITLETVARDVETWRQAKQSRGEKLPEAISAGIAILSKQHKRCHVAKALTISGSTINKILEPDKKTKSLSILVDKKQALYQAWQQSGLSVEAFCKAQNISKTSLYKWIKDQGLGKSQLNWIPLAPKKESSECLSILAELCLPNGWTAKITLPSVQLISFLKEITNAVAIVR